MKANGLILKPNGTHSLDANSNSDFAYLHESIHHAQDT